MSEPIVLIKAVEKSFGATQVLYGVDLTVGRGEVVTVIGPSGSGKTPLLRCVNALETYDAGSIKVDGVEVGFRAEGGRRRPRRDRDLARIRAATGMVFQLFYLFPHLSAAENVMLGLRKVRRMGRAEARERALHWLDRVGLAHRVDSLPSQLSGGQQQRVGIARAVAMEPKVLLLDEITSALDPELVGEVLTVVRGLVGDGMTMLVVTHEMAFAREVSDRIAFMDGGRLVQEGDPESVLRNPASERLRAFLARVA
ncbi:MAG: amino acid ABC transporter ATP-binding protein [Acetobacteraceae bacterium]